MTSLLVSENVRFPELRLPGDTPRDSKTFSDFCTLHPDIVAELDAEGNVIMMTPAGADADGKNVLFLLSLGEWNKEKSFGRLFGPSARFTLPNGALRSPDAAIVKQKDWDGLTDAERKTFAPLCPWFVMELRSSDSDPISDRNAKMEEYRENGAALGRLIDPIEQEVHVYRPGSEVEIHRQPDTLAADPELSGFRCDLTPIWA